MLQIVIGVEIHSFEYDKEKQTRKGALPMTKQRKLRHLEYYDLQAEYDDLYAKSKQGATFTHLTEDDTVYILGDCFWKNEENSVKLIQRLKGHKHLIRGNHDRVHGRLRFYYESIEHYAEINDNDRLVILCHYPIPFYKNQHYGAVMLYGHVHNTREQDFIEKWKRELWESEIPCNMINVGCMMEYMKYTPRTLNEILAANPAPEFRKNTQQKRDDSK